MKKKNDQKFWFIDARAVWLEQEAQGRTREFCGWWGGGLAPNGTHKNVLETARLAWLGQSEGGWWATVWSRGHVLGFAGLI